MSSKACRWVLVGSVSIGTVTRNQVQYTGTNVTIAMLAEPTSAQRQAFELIGAPIPLTVT